MKWLLQRRPLGMPLHLTLVHFALALAAASLVLDLVAWFAWGTDNTVNVNLGAYAVLVAAAIVAVVAALAALATTIDLPDDVRGNGWLYVGAITAIVVVEIVDLFLRNASLRDQAVPPLPLFLTVVALVLLAAAAFLGGAIATREIEEDYAEEEEEPEPVRKRRRRAR